MQSNIDLKDRRVLVTGGAGFIGSSLARRLVGLGARVTVVDALLPRCGANLYNLRDLREQIALHVVDLRDAEALPALVAGQDLIFNLAGLSSHEDSMTEPLRDLEANATAQLTLLECCRRASTRARIVFASTRQIYGRPRYLPVDEAHPLAPTDVNGIHKMAAEQLHMLYVRVHGLPVTTLRLTNTYGPAMRIKDARQTFLGTWIGCALARRPFEVWGGGQLRDFNFVGDVVDALLLAAHDPRALGQVFNLGSSEIVTLAALAAMVTDAAPGAGYRVQAFPEARQRIDIGDYHADYSRFAALGWSPGTSLADGLAATVDYFRRHLEHYA